MANHKSNNTEERLLIFVETNKYFVVTELT